jgi:hypothetical protein
MSASSTSGSSEEVFLTNFPLQAFKTEGRVGIPLSSLTPQHVCACPKIGPYFSEQIA